MEEGLLFNLVLALAAGLLGAMVAVRLRQSVVLGYIVAGVAIGPFTPGLVGDVATVQALADIGIIFLLFAIGVQFSLRDLARVGGVATGGAILQVLAIILLGYLLGMALGWRPLEALFLGAVASNSSSTVLSKVLGERGEADSLPGRIALAWSSVQDLGTVLLIVLLSALAGGNGWEPLDLVWAVGKAGLFLVLLIPLGLRVLPALFEWVAALRNREVFIITVTAVALGTAFVASLFGISLALGAFIAGIVVSESDLSYHIVGEIAPMRDIFAGLFFVSIGMLVDPSAIVSNLIPLLLVLLLIVLAKGAVSTLIALAARYSARTALLTGAILAQSAEFSFLLARLGADLGVVAPNAFAILMAATAFSVVVAPYWYDGAQRLGRRAEVTGLLSRLTGAGEALAAPRSEPRNHAVLCGYGRVGTVVAEALRTRRFPFVVVEEDTRIVGQLRQAGQEVLLGNAANPILLDLAGLAKARVLIVAIPDPVATRQIIEYGLQVNPRLDIVARTHSGSERRSLQARGVREAVLGELEIALEMTRHTLHRFGVSSVEIAAQLQNFRGRIDVGTPDDL